MADNQTPPTSKTKEEKKKGVLDIPISKPREVSPSGDPNNVGSSFYDEQ